MWPDIVPVSAREYRSRELLESALGRPFHSIDGQDVYPTIVEKAAALSHSMIANHPSQNGNKRTAVVSVDAFLVANGYNLALGNSAMYELATCKSAIWLG
jgi:death on curing protein